MKRKLAFSSHGLLSQNDFAKFTIKSPHQVLLYTWLLKCHSCYRLIPKLFWKSPFWVQAKVPPDSPNTRFSSSRPSRRAAENQPRCSGSSGTAAQLGSRPRDQARAVFPAPASVTGLLPQTVPSEQNSIDKQRVWRKVDPTPKSGLWLLGSAPSLGKHTMSVTQPKHLPCGSDSPDSKHNRLKSFRSRGALEETGTCGEVGKPSAHSTGNYLPPHQERICPASQASWLCPALRMEERTRWNSIWRQALSSCFARSCTLYKQNLHMCCLGSDLLLSCCWIQLKCVLSAVWCLRLGQCHHSSIHPRYFIISSLGVLGIELVWSFL